MYVLAFERYLSISRLSLWKIKSWFQTRVYEISVSDRPLESMLYVCTSTYYVVGAYYQRQRNLFRMREYNYLNSWIVENFGMEDLIDANQIQFQESLNACIWDNGWFFWFYQIKVHQTLRINRQTANTCCMINHGGKL